MAEYYELQYETSHQIQEEYGDYAKWVKIKNDEGHIGHHHSITKRVLNARLHLIDMVRLLLKNGIILLDLDPSNISEKLCLHLNDRQKLDLFQSMICSLAMEKYTKPPDVDRDCFGRFGKCIQSWCTSKKSLNEDSEENAKILIAPVTNEKSGSELLFMRLSSDHTLLGDQMPTRFVICIIGPPDPEINYRDLGQCLCDLFSNTIFHRIMLKAKTPERLILSLDQFFDQAVVLAPGQLPRSVALNMNRIKRALTTDASEMRKHGSPNSDSISEYSNSSRNYESLQRTGKAFSGLISDIKNRYGFYISDLKDALHYKCFISTVLIFFITFATAIGLGEILRSKTNGLMGLSETLVSMCVCGVIWGLFSGQPLIIQTKTAAFVILEGGLFAFCIAHDLNFMIVRVWTGLWVLPITILLVAFEAPVLIKYVTRFTEEIIDTLISVVLIFESIAFLAETFIDNPLLGLHGYCTQRNHSNEEEEINMESQIVGVQSSDRISIDFIQNGTHEIHDDFILELHNQPDTAMLTLVLMISTFFLSLYLERLKRSSYFSHTMRKAIGNFSIPITIPLMTLATNMLFSRTTYIHKLDMPKIFSPTRPHLRGWFINPFDIDPPFPTWAIFASIVPAFLLTILIFVELELAEHELALKERGLKKGSGFHLDLVLSGFLMVICGFLGIPWLGAGCVESFSHANALTIHKRGLDNEPKIERVIEQRVTTILVALLQGACAFSGKYLKRIPVAVLMGIFVHLSITNLMQIQFVQRILLYIVPRKYYPDKIYCQKISMWRMHLYTTIQVVCFASLFGIEVIAKICVLFPMIVGMIALVRCWILPCLFSDDELKSLDSEGDLDEDEACVYTGLTRRASRFS